MAPAPNLLPPAAAAAAAAALSAEEGEAGGKDFLAVLVRLLEPHGKRGLTKPYVEIGNKYPLCLQTDAVATALEATGSAFGFLGGWLRERLASIGLSGDEGLSQQQWEQQDTDGATVAAGTRRVKEGGRGYGKRAGAGPPPPQQHILQGVLMVAIMVVAIVVLRRPLASFRVGRPGF